MPTELRFAPDVASIPTYVDDVMRHVGAQYDAPPARMAVTEAMLNAIVHGALAMRQTGEDRDPRRLVAWLGEAGRWCPRERTIGVNVEIGDDRTPIVSVRDPGPGFDWRTALGGSREPPPPDALSGRGLFLVRHGVAGLDFNDEGNEVRLRLRRPDQPSSLVVADRETNPFLAEPAKTIPSPLATRRETPLVLVVDDDPVGRRVLRGVLAGASFDVGEAVDGRAALATIAVSPPDAIVLDLDMPGMSGIEVLAQLRVRGVLDRCPVLVLTATDPSSELRVRAIEAGAWHFLTKPISGAEIVARLRSVLATQSRIDRLGSERDTMDDAASSAAELLASLLPPPELKRLGHVFSSRVMSAGRVGGDLVDVLDVGLLTVAAMLVDVAGSGPSAALTATAVRSLARDRLVTTGEIPAMLVALNERLFEDFAATRQHVAMSTALVDEDEELLHVCNVGNPPVVVVLKTGAMRLVRSSSAPLGLVRRMVPVIETFGLRTVARVLMPSDGLVEHLATPIDSVTALERLSGGRLGRSMRFPSFDAITGADGAHDDASLLQISIDEVTQ